MRGESTEDYDVNMDELLGIRTAGRDESGADLDHNPYEATPYTVLERLANSGLIGKRNTVIDYGCGKGRVGFYLSYQLRCNTIGIERDTRLYEAALRNAQKAAYAKKTVFVHTCAEDYLIPEQADRFYFFNPFSATVFGNVLKNIQTSLAKKPRQIMLLLYYPDQSFFEALSQTPWLSPATPRDISCHNLFSTQDPREVISVYENTIM